MNDPQELFLPYKGSRYLVSNYGRVVGPKGKVLKTSRFSLHYEDGTTEAVRTCRAVAELFIPRPKLEEGESADIVLRTKDGDITNAAVWNLHWEKRPKLKRGVKRCSRCKQILPVTEFYRIRRDRESRGSYCRQCVAEYSGHSYTGLHNSASSDKPRTGAMDGWTEWHRLPYDTLYAMGEEEHAEYCAWWCKAHPIDVEKLANALSIALPRYLSTDED